MDRRGEAAGDEKGADREGGEDAFRKAGRAEYAAQEFTLKTAGFDGNPAKPSRHQDAW